MITLDRLTILLSPYGMRRVNEGLAKWTMVGVWVVAFLLAAVPLFSSLPYFANFYGRSGVCLALHITDEKPNGWEYSVFIFLGRYPFLTLLFNFLTSFFPPSCFPFFLISIYLFFRH